MFAVIENNFLQVVNVYRLITRNTIEEKIMSLQRFKLSIADSVVNIENSSLNSMGTEQIMNMFNREREAPSGGEGRPPPGAACDDGLSLTPRYIIHGLRHTDSHGFWGHETQSGHEGKIRCEMSLLLLLRPFAGFCEKSGFRNFAFM